MPPFDESCVLIPSSTLEDFPSRTSDCDARSLLAGWTVLWHPQLLAETEQLPAWYRADAPPDPPKPRLLVVPEPSRSLIPDGYEERCGKTEGCHWVTGVNREEMLAAIEPFLSGRNIADAADGEREASSDVHRVPSERVTSLTAGSRTIECDDFFALGYAMLQVQIMTRRLRYTSNLDELRIQERTVAAAKAFLAGDAQEAIGALHDAYDCLAEERDHYFASDPSLIDLTLLVPSSVSGWAASLDVTPTSSDFAASEETGTPDDAAAGNVLETPRNVLIDADTADSIAALPAESRERVVAALKGGQLGWAGGGASPQVCFATTTFNEAEQTLRQALQKTQTSLGIRPAVYARYSGASPVDLTAALQEFGIKGIVPIDFAHGCGFGDEAKVIRQSGGIEIEALTAKPIDAASDASFLDIGARLGEAIDGGEIATGLLVHWPGKICDSFLDLRRAASWGLALGRFWRLDAYFIDGEHPYHHEASRAVSPEAATILTEKVESETANPISSLAASFRDRVRQEQQQILVGMSGLVGGSAVADLHRAAAGDAAESEAVSDLAGAAAEFAAQSGWSTEDHSGAAPCSILINSNSVGRRSTVTVRGFPPRRGEHVYKAQSHGKDAAVTVDVPAFGFTRVEAGNEPPKKRWLKLFRREANVAQTCLLQNEFMEVRIDESTGGIAGVYSGAVRGNRFSWRLIHSAGKVRDPSASSMRSTKVRIRESSPDVGSIEALGLLEDQSGRPIARFAVSYTLRCGSRLLEITGKLTSLEPLSPDPWTHYVAARSAVASDATSLRALVRDKVHRGNGRQVVAPLGLELDEPDRKTLIASHGLAFHRRVGDRFVDTILAVRGETEPSFRLDYGFDVRQPVATARSLIAPVAQVALAPDAGRNSPDQGWIVYTAPATLIITRLEVRRRADGKLAAQLRLIQTRNDSATAVVRFCRDVEFARRRRDSAGQSIASEAFWEATADQDGGKIDCGGDQVKCAVGGHSVTDLLVVFSQP